VTVGAVRFCSLELCGCGSAAPYVLAVGDRVEVVRVDASVDSTEVVEFQADRYRADEKFVDGAVRHDDAPGVAIPDLPIAEVVVSRGPQPAVAIRVDLFPHAVP